MKSRNVRDIQFKLQSNFKQLKYRYIPFQMIILIIYATAESSEKNAIEVLLQEGEKIKTFLKYFKYAVRKLNESPDPEAAATTQNKNTSDLIDLLSAESNFNKAKKQANVLMRIISDILNI